MTRSVVRCARSEPYHLRLMRKLGISDLASLVNYVIRQGKGKGITNRKDILTEPGFRTIARSCSRTRPLSSEVA